MHTSSPLRGEMFNLGPGCERPGESFFSKASLGWKILIHKLSPKWRFFKGKIAAISILGFIAFFFGSHVNEKGADLIRTQKRGAIAKEPHLIWLYDVMHLLVKCKGAFDVEVN
jgi:hypothetical protein